MKAKARLTGSASLCSFWSSGGEEAGSSTYLICYLTVGNSQLYGSSFGCTSWAQGMGIPQLLSVTGVRAPGPVYLIMTFYP